MKLTTSALTFPYIVNKKKSFCFFSLSCFLLFLISLVLSSLPFFLSASHLFVVSRIRVIVFSNIMTEAESEKHGVFGLRNNINIENNDELLAWKFFMFVTCKRIKGSKRKFLNLTSSLLYWLSDRSCQKMLHSGGDTGDTSTDELRTGKELGSGWWYPCDRCIVDSDQ